MSAALVTIGQQQPAPLQQRWPAHFHRQAAAISSASGLAHEVSDKSQHASFATREVQGVRHLVKKQGVEGQVGEGLSDLSTGESAVHSVAEVRIELVAVANRGEAARMTGRDPAG